MLRLIFAAAVVLQISLQVQSLMETSDAEQSPWEQTVQCLLPLELIYQLCDYLADLSNAGSENPVYLKDELITKLYFIFEIVK